MTRYLLYILSFFILLLATQTAVAQSSQNDISCQYKVTVLSDEPVSLLYDQEGNLQKDPIALQEFTTGPANQSTCQCLTSFKISNLIGKEISVKLSYQLNLSSDKGVTIVDRTKTHILKKFSSRINYDGGQLCNGTCQIIEKGIKYEFLATNETRGIWGKPNITVCKNCAGKTCLNNGVACQLSIECGGEHCIEGYCSSNELCYNGDCKCSFDKTQCNNRQCVKKGVVPNGQKPVCSWEECNSTYINSTTGYCEKSPEQIHLETIKIITTLFLFLSLGFISYFSLQKHKKDVLKLNKELLDKKIEALNAQNAAIERKKKELEELKKLEHQTKEQRSKIDAIYEDLQRLLDKSKKTLEEYTKPRKSIILGANVWEWRDPEQNNYPCYANGINGNIKTKTLIHRHQAREKIFKKFFDFFKMKYSDLSFEQLYVHHIDHDRDNYRADNLFILSKQEHNLVDHKSIKSGDRASGIKELQRLSFKAPYVPELNELQTKL